MWITILPLIIDLVKEALIVANSKEDPSEKRSQLRTVLQDYSQHQDVDLLRSDLQQFSRNEGSKR